MVRRFEGDSADFACDTLGKPALWATTATFLSDLSLNSLEELPPLTELGELVLPDLMEMPHADEEESETAPSDMLLN